MATIKINLKKNKNTQVKNKIITKYQCGNDLQFSPVLNNAIKYAKFDDPNRNG